MAAGDLENIIPAVTAKLTRNVNFSDVNGILHSVKEVYYSDNNANSHLVWKRDHSPGGDEYSDVFNGTQKILLKYRATSSTITSIKLWSNSDHNHYNEVIKILNASTGDTIYEMHQGVGPSYDTDTLTVDGTSKTVYTIYKDNLNIQVSEGTDYYIYFGTTYSSGNYWVPLVYSNATGDYAEFIGEDYHLQNNDNILSGLTSYSNHKIKAEVNGVQV